jgi:hypothetical protein
LITAVSACTEPTSSKKHSPLLKPLDRAKKVAAMVEAQQLERQKDVMRVDQ